METSELSTFITAVEGGVADFTTANLSTILVAVLGVTAALGIAWFAYRLIVRKVAGAMKSGKIG